ncbi:MAG: cation-transporting P-type ATPase [Thiobacillus sp.]
MAEAHQQSADEAIKQQESSAETGLTREEADRRRTHYGPNRLQEMAARPTWRILIDQLKSIVILLLLSAAAAAVFGRLLETVAIGAAVLINTVIGFGMELRATRAMEALQRMGKVTARVLRDGQASEIEADALVPGDIVLLEAGGVIAADLRLIEANDLQCDESALTGESVAVDKRTEALAESDMPLGERSNMAYKGTAVTQGSGSGIVVATGMDTELGHISRWVEQAGGEITPLEKRLDALGAFATALLVLGMAPGQAVTVSFLTFGFARLWHIFNMRDPNSALLKNEITGTPPDLDRHPGRHRSAAGGRVHAVSRRSAVGASVRRRRLGTMPGVLGSAAVGCSGHEAGRHRMGKAGAARSGRTRLMRIAKCQCIAEPFRHPAANDRHGRQAASIRERLL